MYGFIICTCLVSSSSSLSTGLGDFRFFDSRSVDASISVDAASAVSTQVTDLLRNVRDDDGIWHGLKLFRMDIG